MAEAQLIAEDSDRKYDEVIFRFDKLPFDFEKKDEKNERFFPVWVQVARRIAIMEVDLERAEDRAEAAEA